MAVCYNRGQASAGGRSRIGHRAALEKGVAVNAIEFIQSTLFELNRSFVNEVEPLTEAQMLYRPTPQANSIAFLLWHFTRTEDNSFHRVSSVEGTPSVWARENWHERLGLPETGSGTGFTPDQVEAHKPGKEGLVGYMEAVRQSVQDGLSGMTDDDLDRPLDPDNPRQTVGRNIQSIIIGHGFFHLGEVRFLKGLQGMPFPR